ncbi:hypothetical protein BJY01DRAFT_199874 [Aspergillus pseudoustus]|uniref:NAD(P)-binding protein n=1 Tax=Aspergillus pseudoustus TaxID=1810923 RepID=A0ABR4JRT4_9EURO
MAPNPVALILGAGPRVGASVAAAFHSKGYSVATASRSGTGAKTSEGYLSLAADFANPSSIPPLFDSVKEAFGAAPSVVVYNAASLTPPPDNESILSVSEERFVHDLNINTVSPYVAAQKAVEAWATLPGDVKKTFIYTGNPLNVRFAPVPLFLDLGVGKRASTYWIAVADEAYAAKGYRFHYADQRAKGGSGIGPNLDGPAHGEFYPQLASHEGAIPWHATFVAGEGYGKFD